MPGLSGVKSQLGDEQLSLVEFNEKSLAGDGGVFLDFNQKLLPGRFLSMSKTKKSLRSVLKDAMQHAGNENSGRNAGQCVDNPDEQITIVGNYEDFNAEEYFRVYSDQPKYVIHNGKILLIECPSRLHSTAAFSLTSAIASSLEKSTSQYGKSIFVGGNDPSTYWVNVLGCGKAQNKEPDGVIQVMPRYCCTTKEVVYPLVLEVGCCHENLHLLFVETAAWLNQYTDTEYCVILKLYPQRHRTFEARLYLLKRTLPSRAQLATGSASQQIIHKKCLDDSANLESLSTEEIKSIYNVTVDQMLVINDLASMKTSVNTNKPVLVLELGPFLKHCLFYDTTAQYGTFQVDLSDVFEVLRDIFNWTKS